MSIPRFCSKMREEIRLAGGHDRCSLGGKASSGPTWSSSKGSPFPCVALKALRSGTRVSTDPRPAEAEKNPSKTRRKGPAQQVRLARQAQLLQDLPTGFQQVPRWRHDGRCRTVRPDLT